MTTALSIIQQALRKINVFGDGQDLPFSDAQNALTALNNMMSGWSAEGGVTFNLAREEFSLTGAQSYTIGSGGDFNTTKPIEIEAASVTQGDIDYPLDSYSVEQWSNLTDKDTTGVPTIYFYDSNTPLGTLYLYPKPDASYTLTLFSRKELTAFTDLNDDITLPAGYERALVYNLAVELAPEYEKGVTGLLLAASVSSKKDIFVQNTRHNRPMSKQDWARDSRYNIYRGW